MLTTKSLLFAAPMVLALCTGSQAEILDLSDMVADVNGANAGAELITPQFKELNQGEGGCTAANGCFSIRFKISKVVKTNTLKWATNMYTTPEKILSYPTCAGTDTAETDWQPKFVRAGNTMTAGFNVSTECFHQDTAESYSYEKNTAYLYMTNVSAVNGSTKVYSYPDSQLVGLNTTGNLNAYGMATDIMATMNYVEGNNAGTLRIDVFEPTTSYRYISDMVVVAR